MNIILWMKRTIVFIYGFIVFAMSGTDVWGSKRPSSLNEEMKALMAPAIYKPSTEEFKVENGIEIPFKGSTQLKNGFTTIYLLGGFTFFPNFFDCEKGQALLRMIQLKE